MFLWDWLNKVLSYLGFGKKSGKLVLLGLDNAGKTTLLRMLKDEKLAQPVPNAHPICEELILGNIRFTTYDLGGHKQVRKLWKEYYPIVDGVVFIIDVSERHRFNECIYEFESLLADEELNNIPIVLLGNKIDKSKAVSEQEIREIFNLYSRTTGQDIVKNENLRQRPMELFMCSILYQQGYGEAFRWLSQHF